MSRSAYFKRKFAADDEAPLLSFRTYCQPVAPVQEERAHVLRLSLEKMRYMDDPEVFLRRSVLINNLLHRLRAEILLPSANWCFPPNPVLTSGPWNLPPTAGSAHQALHRALPTRICLPPPAGPPLRKRFRVVPSGPGPDCSQTCCCVYEAAGHYLQLPFSMYDAALSSTGSTSKLHLTGQGKPGPSTDKEEDKDAEEEEEREQEVQTDKPRPEEAFASHRKFSRRTKTLEGRKDMRTEGSRRTGRAGEEREQEGEEEEEEEEGFGPCLWDSERDLHKRLKLLPGRAQRPSVLLECSENRNLLIG
uniref:SERTA domain containing 4 n=2 Tax=Cyprinodon variegatus TaxID=28743 RepID=A0A3Q2EJU8_CYPVA